MRFVRDRCRTCQRKQPSVKDGECLWCSNKRAHGHEPKKRSPSPFAFQGQASYVSARRFQQDILRLVNQIPPDVTAIVGVARSGLSAATMVSMYLHLPLFAIRQTAGDVVACGNGWRLGGFNHVDKRPGRVCVVDDTVMTGNSLEAISHICHREFGDHVTSAVYVNPSARRKPDVHAVDLLWPHLLEWNLFNSVLSPNVAMDFDGILCEDCRPDQDDDGPRYREFIRNARWRYVPRKVPVPLVVTARVEKYRQPTLQWLRERGIAVHKLVMHPAKTLAERRGDDIAAFKADHYGRWLRKHRPTVQPALFVESDDNQARRIAQLSGYLTLCPATEQVYGL